MSASIMTFSRAELEEAMRDFVGQIYSMERHRALGVAIHALQISIEAKNDGWKQVTVKDVQGNDVLPLAAEHLAAGVNPAYRIVLPTFKSLQELVVERRRGKSAKALDAELGDKKTFYVDDANRVHEDDGLAFYINLKQTSDIEAVMDGIDRGMFSKIICFGLDTMSGNNTMNIEVYGLHQMVRHLAGHLGSIETLIRVHAGIVAKSDDEIREKIFGPAGNNDSIPYKCLPDLETMEQMDIGTMVVSLRPKYLVRQRLADIMHEDAHRPMAILCNSIDLTTETYVLGGSEAYDPISPKVQDSFNEFYAPFTLGHSERRLLNMPVTLYINLDYFSTLVLS